MRRSAGSKTKVKSSAKSTRYWTVSRCSYVLWRSRQDVVRRRLRQVVRAWVRVARRQPQSRHRSDAACWSPCRHDQAHSTAAGWRWRARVWRADASLGPGLRACRLRRHRAGAVDRTTGAGRRRLRARVGGADAIEGPGAEAVRLRRHRAGAVDRTTGARRRRRRAQVGEQTPSKVQVPVQFARAVAAQVPSSAQQEPVGWTHGFGSQTPAADQAPVQFACAVTTQVPIVEQQEPDSGVVSLSPPLHPADTIAAITATIHSLRTVRPPSLPPMGSADRLLAMIPNRSLWMGNNRPAVQLPGAGAKRN